MGAFGAGAADLLSDFAGVLVVMRRVAVDLAGVDFGADFAGDLDADFWGDFFAPVFPAAFFSASLIFTGFPS